MPGSPLLLLDYVSETQPLHTPSKHLQRKLLSHAVSRDRAYLVTFFYKATLVTSASRRLIEWENWEDLKDHRGPLYFTERTLSPPSGKD